MHKQKKPSTDLSVRLGNALDLILLLDGVGVGGLLGAIDDLVREALRDGLDVAEGGVARAGGDEVDGLVHRGGAGRHPRPGGGRHRRSRCGWSPRGGRRSGRPRRAPAGGSCR